MLATNHTRANQHDRDLMNSPETHRLILVEDDFQLASMIAEFLKPHGFQVSIESRGDVAVDRIQKEVPDVVILDVNLPGMDGFGVCRAIRQSFSGPVLILTARGDEIDEVVGLEVGADDYLAKPVRPRALLARLKVHLKKANQSDSLEINEITVGGMKINARSRSVWIDEEPIHCSTAEFDLLWLLAENAGQVLSRNDIYQQLHGTRYDGFDRSIDLRVSRLRRKLDGDSSSSKRIVSVRGVGYLLAAEQ